MNGNYWAVTLAAVLITTATCCDSATALRLNDGG
jgi:hypothetical protein